MSAQDGESSLVADDPHTEFERLEPRIPNCTPRELAPASADWVVLWDDGINPYRARVEFVIGGVPDGEPDLLSMLEAAGYSERGRDDRWPWNGCNAYRLSEVRNPHVIRALRQGAGVRLPWELLQAEANAPIVINYPSPETVKEAKAIVDVIRASHDGDDVNRPWERLRAVMQNPAEMEPPMPCHSPTSSCEEADVAATSALSQAREATSGRDGRPRNPDDDWAYEQIQEGRARNDVFAEWRQRPGVKSRDLVDEADSFKKAIRFREKREKSASQGE